MMRPAAAAIMMMSDEETPVRTTQFQISRNVSRLARIAEGQADEHRHQAGINRRGLGLCVS